MAEIQLEGVTKSFENQRNSKRTSPQKATTQQTPSPNEIPVNRQNAVDNLDLFVEDGEFLVLVGPSGCGKTTTLRLIAGLEHCDQGRISIGGRDVTMVSPSKRDVAMVFQNYALYPHMTVYKNMAFGLEVKYGRGVFDVLRRFFRPSTVTQKEEQRRGIESRVSQAAKMLGIESLLNRRPHQLSGGERQRVALGRAIVRDPAAFLFDEPLSNLDAKLRNKMRLELGQLHLRLKATSVYVTHDQTEAMSLGDRIAVMNHGRIQQIGTPEEVYLHPANPFVASFIGTNPMNLIPARWYADSQSIGIQTPGSGPATSRSEDSQDSANGNSGGILLCGEPENQNLPIGGQNRPAKITGWKKDGADCHFLDTVLADAFTSVTSNMGTDNTAAGDKAGNERNNKNGQSGSQIQTTRSSTTKPSIGNLAGKQGLWTIGIRPEHWQPCPAGTGQWQVEIRAIDRLGDHNLLHVEPITIDPTNISISSTDAENNTTPSTKTSELSIPSTQQEPIEKRSQGQKPHLGSPAFTDDSNRPNSDDWSPAYPDDKPAQTSWWTVRVATNEYQVGAKIGLKTEGDKLHFFDALTGQNLRDG